MTAAAKANVYGSARAMMALILGATQGLVNIPKKTKGDREVPAGNHAVVSNLERRLDYQGGSQNVVMSPKVERAKESDQEKTTLLVVAGSWRIKYDVPWYVGFSEEIKENDLPTVPSANMG